MKKYQICLNVALALTCGHSLEADVFSDAAHKLQDFGNTVYNGAKIGVETSISIVTGTKDVVTEIGPLINDIKGLISGITGAINGIMASITTIKGQTTPLIVTDQSLEMLLKTVEILNDITPLLKRINSILIPIGEKIIGNLDSGVRDSLRTITAKIDAVTTKINIINQQFKTVLMSIRVSNRNIHGYVHDAVDAVHATKF
jgi:phage-related minor tail protein